MSRFDYIRYDEKSQMTQNRGKALCEALEEFINHNIMDPRAKASALTQLELTYVWIGKGIKEDQIVRNKGKFELQEERKDEPKFI